MSRYPTFTLNYPRPPRSVLSDGGATYSSILGGGSNSPFFSNDVSSPFGVNTSLSQEKKPTLIPIANTGIPSFLNKFILLIVKLNHSCSLQEWKGKHPFSMGSGMRLPCNSTLPMWKNHSETSIPFGMLSVYSEKHFRINSETKKVGMQGKKNENRGLLCPFHGQCCRPSVYRGCGTKERSVLFRRIGKHL